MDAYGDGEFSLGRETPDHGLTANLHPAMGEALIFALHLQLGDAFTPDLQAAWLEFERLASAIMQRGELSRIGEFTRYRTGEYAALQAQSGTKRGRSSRRPNHL